MGGDDSEQKPESNAENERPKRMTRDARRIVGEFLLLGLFLLFDVIEVWPTHPFLALLGGAIGVSALAFTELSTALWATITAASTVCAFAIYSYVPLPTGTPSPELRPIPETEIVGELQPAGEPVKTACDNSRGVQAPPNTLRVLVGSIAMEWIGKSGQPPLPISPILLGGGRCPVITLKPTSDGFLSIDSDLYGATGNLIAKIRDNNFRAIDGPRSTVSREGDLSTLVIHDGEGRELLYVRYLNATTVMVRGVFGCPGYRPVSVGYNGIGQMISFQGPAAPVCMANTPIIFN